jgi:hypothetical protein
VSQARIGYPAERALGDMPVSPRLTRGFSAPPRAWYL